MGPIISWIRATGGWVRSPFGDLPSLRVDDTPLHQTWLILAGGIGLILSRASQSELEERFAAARQVYDIARGRLRKRRLPKPDPNLLRNALHEVRNLADPMTMEAGRECLMRAVDRQASKTRLAAAVAAAAGAPTGAAAANSSVTTTQAASTQAVSTQAIAHPDEHAATQLDLDLLFERSNKLREAVAWARTTTFGQDN